MRRTRTRKATVTSAVLRKREREHGDVGTDTYIRPGNDGEGPDSDKVNPARQIKPKRNAQNNVVSRTIRLREAILSRISSLKVCCRWPRSSGSSVSCGSTAAKQGQFLGPMDPGPEDMSTRTSNTLTVISRNLQCGIAQMLGMVSHEAFQRSHSHAAIRRAWHPVVPQDMRATPDDTRA